ncbi:MAG: cell division protein FtsZ, partial [Methylocystis sp.]
MTINLKAPELRELKPRIIVCGVGGGGCNAVNNMIASGLSGVDFLVANTDAQALASARADRIIQMGLQVTEGLGAGAQPEVGRAAAEEARDEIREHLTNAHMCFVTAGMGGGTGTGAAPVIAMIAREMGILTVGVVTKPFHFEGQRRQRIAESGIGELQKCVDTLIVIPNQNLFRIATEKTTFADAFAMADQVLYSGVASVTDLMVKEGLINLDFADVRSIMRGMGKAMMGTGEATGERRAILSAEAAIANPLLDEVSMKGARGLLISITGGNDLTLYEVDEAASRIRQEVDEEANIILGATFDSSLEGVIRVSVVATGIDPEAITVQDSGLAEARISEEAVERLRAQIATQQSRPKPALVVESTPAPVPAAASSYFAREAPAASAAPVYQSDEAATLGYYAEPQYQEPARERATHGVYIEPAPSRPAYAEPPRRFTDEDRAPGRASAPEDERFAGPYVPPAPEQPARGARMPQIEDFPRPGQEQLRQARGEISQADQRRKSIFERLASFGSSRQEDAIQS